MNWYVLMKHASSEVTAEMREFFQQRTDRHISLVGKYCNLIADEFPEFAELRERAKVHDDSKYEAPEYEPYLWVTWKHKCKDEGAEFEVPDEISEKMDTATFHHITTNSHHPEYHASGLKPGKENRPKIVDATAMPRLDIAEMVADWAGMSEEKGTGLKDWADKTVGVRWKFTDEQKDLIYELIGFIE